MTYRETRLERWQQLLEFNEKSVLLEVNQVRRGVADLIKGVDRAVRLNRSTGLTEAQFDDLFIRTLKGLIRDIRSWK